MSAKQKGKVSKLRMFLGWAMLVLGALLLGFIIISYLVNPLDEYSFWNQVLSFVCLAALPFVVFMSGIFVLKCQKFIKKILLTFLLSLGVAVVLFLGMVIFAKSDISTSPQSFGVQTSRSSSQSKTQQKKSKEHYYPSETEALNHFKKIRGKTAKDFFYIKDLGDTIHYFYTSQKMKTFAVYTLEVKDGNSFKASEGTYLTKDFTPDLFDSYDYDCDDAVCEHISWEFVDKFFPEANISAMAEQGLYFGMWHNKKEVKSLTILGKHVDKIIPVKSGKKVYYFWIMENPEITKSLEDFNFSTFTYRKLTKHLHIKYTKSKK